MPYTPLTVERFAGLNLAADPSELGWAGAVSVQNVDFDLNGTVRSRPGYDKTDATTISGTPLALFRDRTAGMYLLITTTHYTVYDSSFVDTGGAAHGNSLTGSGVEANGKIYLANTADILSSWSQLDGFNSPALAGSPRCRYVAVQPNENRLVCAYAAIAASPRDSRVHFSQPGYTTFGASDWVDLHPDDGREIRAAIAWRDLTVVFKEDKFYVFYGNSVGPTGAAVFNYRTMDTGVGCAYDHAACAAQDGIYFIHQDGIYRTTGGVPELVSGPIQAFFDGRTNGIFSPVGPLSTPRIHAGDDRLYVWQKGATGMFVMDLRSREWTYWVLAVAPHTLAPLADPRELLFNHSTGHLHKLDPAYTDDDGTAIASHYQAGFGALADGAAARIRRFKLTGSGTVTHTLYGDHSVASQWNGGAAASVVLGASPVVARAYANQSGRAHDLAFKVGAASGAWALNRWEALIADARDLR